ncbi:MAG TPA: HD domain-containing protein, partial [Armatimonadota bacterium]|nr:HD domain-containing protein [Armatimonadota bacterium]
MTQVIEPRVEDQVPATASAAVGAAPPMDPAVLADLERLLERVSQYNPQVDRDLVRAAVELAHAAHRGQLRDSGEPYIYHPLKTAHILADMEMDQASIIAGILH